MSRARTTKNLANSRSRRQYGASYEQMVMNGRLELEEAFKRLASQSATQKVSAAHIALELAKKHQRSQKEVAQHWLEASVDSFRKASIESSLGGTACLLTLSRAELGMVHARSIESLLTLDRLPDSRTALAIQSMYLKGAHKLAEARRSLLRSGHTSSAQDALGLMGEMAVLVLCQRFAIREVGSESWFPYQATLFEDKANRLESDNLNHGWDVSIYTNIDNTTEPKLDYRVQVKSSETAYRRAVDAPGISRVHIYPDLKRDNDKNSYDTIANILINCEAELFYETTPKEISDTLDDQTGKLLEIIDIGATTI